MLNILVTGHPQYANIRSVMVPVCNLRGIQMPSSTRDDIVIQLDKFDTELEAQDADKTGIMQRAQAWIANNPAHEAGDAIYYAERLQAIRKRHGM